MRFFLKEKLSEKNIVSLKYYNRQLSLNPKHEVLFCDKDFILTNKADFITKQQRYPNQCAIIIIILKINNIYKFCLNFQRLFYNTKKTFHHEAGVSTDFFSFEFDFLNDSIMIVFYGKKYNSEQFLKTYQETEINRMLRIKDFVKSNLMKIIAENDRMVKEGKEYVRVGIKEYFFNIGYAIFEHKLKYYKKEEIKKIVLKQIKL